MPFVYDDGGRAAAGYKGSTGDCVTRAIAIATGKPYGEVYDALHALAKGSRLKRDRGRSPRDGVRKTIIRRYMESIGWQWTPTMQIGSGCKVHLAKEELPSGRLVVSVSKHLTAVIDGTVRDTHNPQREVHAWYAGRGHVIERRCVYGYFSRP